MFTDVSNYAQLCSLCFIVLLQFTDTIYKVQRITFVVFLQ